MSNSQVISFRASGHFLNWIEAQREEGESPSQAAMRILKEFSVMSTSVNTELSTRNHVVVESTELSTVVTESVDTQIAASLEPVMQRMTVIEERLGKLRA